MKRWREVQGRRVFATSGDLCNGHYDLTDIELNEYAKQGWEVFSIGWGKNPQGEPVMRKALLCCEDHSLFGAPARTP